MANQRQIKRRISTAKNISQITKAMEMVSASKMKRAQAQALAARPYTRALQASLQKVTKDLDTAIHPLLTQHYQGKDVLILLSTDKGLVGGLNNHLFKEALEWIKQNKNGLVIPVGKKAVRFCQLAGASIHAQFTELAEKLSTSDIAPITTLITNGYLEKEFQTVSILYMDFINTLSQKSRKIQLLPLQHIQQKEIYEQVDPVVLNPKIHQEYIFEPSAQAILNDLLPYYIENTLYQAFLEAKASEHSSRMVAMKNASENAGDLMKELKLLYNKTRQANITSELIDMSTASLTVQ
jgi:F-type H+-transporting ATPase subunit gamma